MAEKEIEEFRLLAAFASGNELAKPNMISILQLIKVVGLPL